MLKAVYFVDEDGVLHSEKTTAEMQRTVEMLEREGFRSGILHADPVDPEQQRNSLFLCGSGERLRSLRASGLCAVGYSNADNPREGFSGAAYIVQEPDYVDADSYTKMYEREAGLPWTILRTPRCLVREFTVEDLDGIYALYDAEARRFLEPPSPDRSHEKEILRAYIDRIYRLYGFGHWAVILNKEGNPAPAAEKESLIGRVGFAALTARQEREALALGLSAGIPVRRMEGEAAGEGRKQAPAGGQHVGREQGAGNAEHSGIDADFGFLIAAPFRGCGIAEEVCREILRYGFSMLGFSRVRADARMENVRSRRFLEKLGFVPVGTAEDESAPRGGRRQVFICDGPA